MINQKQYIQFLNYFEQHKFVVCFYEEQAQILMKQKSFKVNMSFKRVWTYNVNEIVFAMFNQSIKKDKWSFIDHVLIYDQFLINY